MSENELEKYGYDDFFIKQLNDLKINDADLKVARVTEVQKEQYNIIRSDVEKRARLKSSIFYENKDILYPTVGDFVLIKPNPSGDDTIYYVFERKSKFSRLDTFNIKEQVVAANFDYTFIMTSLNKDFNIGRIERYLASAYQSGATPIIVLTKLDLCKDEYISIRDEIELVAPGVSIVAISAHTGEGMDELKSYIKPSKTIVFLGSSGVGKSSLVNALSGKETMYVNQIREDDSKGRHTTTYRQLIILENGCMVIDTPGMRELGMWDAVDGMSTTFSEIEILGENCKFKDCQHENEPGCAVKKALEEGTLSQSRWNSYVKLIKETKFAQRKELISAMQKEKARVKSISKFQKEIYKDRTR